VNDLTPYERKLIAEALRLYIEHLKYIPKRYTGVQNRIVDAQTLVFQMVGGYDQDSSV
jgi:hypothetical protein